MDNLQAGDRISATATEAKYGTSEPAANAIARYASGTRSRTSNSTVNPPATPATPAAPVVPQCTTPPAPPQTPPETPPQTPPQTPIQLRVPRNIHFALDKDIISPASAAVLDRVIEILQQYPMILVEMEGHTDPRASNAYNLDLGNRRSMSVRKYLLRRGIAPERMTIRSYGETQRRTSGAGRIDYARDRRVELNFIDATSVDIIFEYQEDDLQPE